MKPPIVLHLFAYLLLEQYSFSQALQADKISGLPDSRCNLGCDNAPTIDVIILDDQQVFI